jgi:hypothetical protein
MAFPRELPNVVPKGFVGLLPTTLQIPGFAWPYVCVLEVSDEDLLEIFLAIDRVSRHVAKPDRSHVG